MIWIAIPLDIVGAVVFWLAIDRFLYVPSHDTEPWILPPNCTEGVK